MLQHTDPNQVACAAASADPSLLATDLADYLVKKGMPFRKAHHVVGQLVALAEKQGKSLAGLAASEFRAVDKLFGEDVAEVLDLHQAMARRNLIGAPGTDEVRSQLTRWQKLFGAKAER